MTESRAPWFGAIVRRAVVLMLLGAAVGLVANAVSPRGIPLVTPPKKILAAEDVISLEEARAAWETGAAIFLDARRFSDYARGHIAGALSLPHENFDEKWPEIAKFLAPNLLVVCYCDGEDCELSHKLADKLRELGHTNVKILVNGWTIWTKNGLPTGKI
jgi:rhodanese-related sulfurtransferase